MNAQTQGPLTEQGGRLMTPRNPSVAAIPARLNDANEWEHRTPENAANARLLAAAYSSFDQAGRELGIDALELANLDLVALIRGLRQIAKEKIDGKQSLAASVAIGLLLSLPK